ALAAWRYSRSRAHPRTGADRGPHVDALRPFWLDGTARRQRQHHPWAEVTMQERSSQSAKLTATDTGETTVGEVDAVAASLDPVDYAVISHALIAIAREMGTKLVRSSYSNIVREAQDASAALFDAQGNVVAQAELIPMHLGSMSEIFRACIEQCPSEALKPGDFYINNDPYGGGQHLHDGFIFTPIFAEGGVIAFAASGAQHLHPCGGPPGRRPHAVE